MHSLHSITRRGVLTAWLCYHLCQCLAKPASAGTMLPCRILLMGVGVAHQKTGGEGRVEELQCLFLSVSTTSDIARAGHQTCEGLTWQVRPLQPPLLCWCGGPSNVLAGEARPVVGSGAGPPQSSQPCSAGMDVFWGIRTATTN